MTIIADAYSLSTTTPTWVCSKGNPLVRYEVMVFDGSAESEAAVTEWLRRTIEPKFYISPDDGGYGEFRLHGASMSTPVDRGEVIVRLNATFEASRVPFFSYGNTWTHEFAETFNSFNFVVMEDEPEVTVDPHADWLNLNRK